MVIADSAGCERDTTILNFSFPDRPGIVKEKGCLGADRTAQFCLEGGCPWPQVDWSISSADSLLVNKTDSCAVADFTGQSPGTYDFALAVQDSGRGCHDTLTFDYNLENRFLLSMTGEEPLCQGNCTELYAASNVDSVQYNWYKGQKLLYRDTSQITVCPDDTTTYHLEGKHEGCVSQTSQRIPVTPNIKLEAGPDTSIFYGNTVELEVRGGRDYTWFPTHSLDNPSSPSPIAAPDTTTYYRVSSSNKLCEDKDTVTVKVNYDLLIPNAFSPNNDGTNDYFKIKDHGIKELITFKIYNRWGEVIWEADNIQEAKKGWDGNYKGKPQEVGVYAYVIKVRMLNDSIRGPINGDITLIR